VDKEVNFVDTKFPSQEFFRYGWRWQANLIFVKWNQDLKVTFYFWLVKPYFFTFITKKQYYLMCDFVWEKSSRINGGFCKGGYVKSVENRTKFKRTQTQKVRVWNLKLEIISWKRSMNSQGFFLIEKTVWWHERCFSFKSLMRIFGRCGNFEVSVNF
jgi:hypothetical protein